VYKPLGAPTEVSLLTLGQKAGLQQKQLQDSKPRVGAIPFESEHKVGVSGTNILRGAGNT
jgi:magnesium-transporting ATPase (P-type)